MGEMLCLLVFKLMYYKLKGRQDGSENVHELTKGNRDFNPSIFFFPAFCDMSATSLMYIGLGLTYPSSFQILRGSVIVFVGMLSVGFLQRVLKQREWAGIGFIIVGLIVVGLSDFLSNIDPSFTRFVIMFCLSIYDKLWYKHATYTYYECSSRPTTKIPNLAFD